MTFVTEIGASTPPGIYPASAFGAVAGTDGTAAIQGAISEAEASGVGGRILLPPGLITLSEPVIVSTDNIEIVGVGWASELIAASGFPAGDMIQVQAPASGFRYGARFADFYLNVNNQAGVNGIHVSSTYHALFDHLRVRFCNGTGIWLDGNASQFGAYNWVRHCVLSEGAAGIGIATSFNEWNTLLGCLLTFYNTAGGVGFKCTDLNCMVLGSMFDNNDTGIWQAFGGRLTVQGCQFDRGQTRFIYLQGSQYSSIVGNVFNTYNGTAGTGAIDVADANNAGNVVVGNTLRGGSGWANFVYEHGSLGTPPNTYEANDTGGSAIVLINGTARDNRGVNPRGHSVAQPAVPASATAYTNVLGADCTVYVTCPAGVTVSAVAIGGAATGATIAASTTGGPFRVPANQTITLTYAGGTPTWSWYGD